MKGNRKRVRCRVWYVPSATGWGWWWGGWKRVRTSPGRTSNQQDKTHSAVGRARVITLPPTVRHAPVSDLNSTVSWVFDRNTQKWNITRYHRIHPCIGAIQPPPPIRQLPPGHRSPDHRNDHYLKVTIVMTSSPRNHPRNSECTRWCLCWLFATGVLLFRCTSPGDADSCQMLSRKKRRGVIEKKRRDRINTSLSELKRLVPTAFEKQGSAKLEKAEILQMTVDHLKNLHAKGNQRQQT